MNTKFLLPVAILSALALAACDQPKTPAAPAAETTTTTTTTTPAPAAETPAPAAETPAITPAITPESAMQAIQEQAATLTDAQKQEAIAAARKAAEDAAKAQNLTAEQVTQAGDMAETAAKQMFGVQ